MSVSFEGDSAPSPIACSITTAAVRVHERPLRQTDLILSRVRISLVATEPAPHVLPLRQDVSVVWTPFGAVPEKHGTLIDGTPDWMLASLRLWFKSEFSRDERRTNGYGGAYTATRPRVDRMRDADLALRGRPFSDMLAKLEWDSTFDAMTPEERLALFDWVIKENVRTGEKGNEHLEQVLRAGGSKWKVGTRNGEPGLEERVPQGVQDAADAAMTLPGDAGRLLSEAWHATYGMNPQPDLGYRKAIEAVEAVVLPMVIPNDASGHLGRAISQMRVDADWKLPFVKEHAKNPSHGVVLSMIQALWSGHSDRHPGTADYVPSTQEAAEAAVSLAVTLVNLFSSGGVARR